MRALPWVLQVTALGIASTCVVAVALIVARWLRVTGTARLVLALAVLCAAQVVLAVEALSLVHALSGPALLSVHGSSLGALLAAGLRPSPLDLRARARAARAAMRRLPWVDRALALGVLLAGLVLLFLVAHVPPNNFDSLQYHLTRAMAYLQQGSLDAYPTPDVREVAFPAGAEILVLWPWAFWPHVRTAGLVQWLAWALSGPAVYAVARRLGCESVPSVRAALVFLSLPAAVLQATTAQNDLLTAFFVLCAFVFVPEDRAGVVLGALALALALATKTTAYLAVPGLAAWSVVHVIQTASGDRHRALRRLMTSGASCAVCVALWGAYFPLQNLRRYGHAAGPEPFRELLVLDRMTPRVVWSNLGRLALRALEPEGVLPRGAPADALARGHQAVSETAFRVLGIDRALPEDHPDSASAWRPSPAVVVSEDVTTFGPVFAVLLMPALVLATVRGPGAARVLAFAAVAYVVLAAATLRWQVWHGRILLTAAALAAPLFASLLAGRARGSAGGNAVVAAACASCLLTCTLYNDRKALLGPARVAGDATARLRVAPVDEGVLRVLDALQPPVRRLALVAGAGDVRSPFFGPHLARRVETFRLEHVARLDPARLLASDVVVVRGESQGYFPERADHRTPSRYWGVADLAPDLDALRRSPAWRRIVDLDGAAHVFVRADGVRALMASAPDVVGITPGLGDHWIGPSHRAAVRRDPARSWLAIEGESGQFGFPQAMTVKRLDGAVVLRNGLPPAGAFRVDVSVPSLGTDAGGEYVGFELVTEPIDPARDDRSPGVRPFAVRLLRLRLVPATEVVSGRSAG